MLIISKLLVAALALGLSTVTANPRPVPDGTPIPPTCTPTLSKSTYVTYVPKTITTSVPVTLGTAVLVPHSCYTYTTVVPLNNTAICGKFDPATCPPHILCVKVTTLTMPCTDPCCPVTKTSTVRKGCPTCVVGCDTFTETVTASCK